ncbi:MAG: hypothetical protein JSR77_18430 [Planctomycetes bacterium]|nr:hypothetical protein [Planctomycetota bacterium]
MASHLQARRWRLASWACAAFAVATLALWGATLRRSAWGAAAWPRFWCVSNGRVMVFSSLWNGGLFSNGWIYDAIGTTPNPWLPAYERIGDTYSGTPAYVTRLHAASVPLWYFGVAPVGVACWSRKRARSLAAEAGQSACAGCGYSRAGLRTVAGGQAVCPECGRVLEGA